METNNFSTSELIYLFIDGEANDVQKSVLFKSVADDNELMNEFTDALNIKKASDNHASLFVPPLALSQSLFAKAGLGGYLPALDKAPSRFNEFLSTNYALIKSKLIFGLICASIGAVLTWGILRTIPDKHDSVQLASSNDNQNSSKTIPTDTNTKNIAQQIEPGIIKSSPKHININKIPASLAQNSDNMAKTDIPQNDKTELSQNVVVPLDNKITKENINTDKKPEAVINSEPVNTINKNEFTSFLPVLFNNKVKVQVKGIAGLAYLPYRQFQNNNSPLLNNSGVSLFYDLSDNHSLNLDLTQETYPIFINFTGSSYDFRSSLLSITGGYRYTVDKQSWLLGLQPYGQLNLGYCISGFILKPSLGLIFTPESRVSFSIGVEGTRLYYKDNGQTFSADKFGLIYGVAVKF